MKTFRPLQTGMYCMAEKKYCCLARIEGDVILAPDQHQIYEIIDTPPQPERDLRDVANEIRIYINSFASGFDAGRGFTYQKSSNIDEGILKILQQADKPAPKKRKTKGWINIYKNGRAGVLWETKELADINGNGIDDRIACKEIEIELERHG